MTAILIIISCMFVGGVIDMIVNHRRHKKALETLKSEQAEWKRVRGSVGEGEPWLALDRPPSYRNTGAPGFMKWYREKLKRERG